MANDVTVKFGVDGKPMEAGLKRAQGQVEAFSKRAESTVGAMAKRMGGMLAAGLSIRALKSTMDEFDRIGKLATRLDTTTDAIQRIGLAAELSGSSVEDVARAMSLMMRQLDDPKNTAFFDALRRLDLDPVKLKTADAWGQFMMLANAFQKAQQSGSGLSDIYKVLGKSANELLPLLMKSREELDKIGSVNILQESEIRKIEALNDRFTELSKTIKGALMQGILTFVDGFDKVAEMNEKALYYMGRYNEEIKRGATFKEAEAAAKQQIEEMRAVEKAQEEPLKTKTTPSGPTPQELEADQRRAEEELEAEEKRAEAKRKFLALMNDEMRLLQAKISGDKTAIAAEERRLAIKSKALQIETAGVKTGKEALRLATMMVDMDQKAKAAEQAAKEKDPKAEKEKLDLRQKLIETVEHELKLAQAKANFDEAEIIRLERQAAIRKRKNDLIAEGMEAAAAEAVATQMQALKEQEERGPQQQRKPGRQRMSSLDEFYLRQEAVRRGAPVGSRFQFKPGEKLTSESVRAMTDDSLLARLGLTRITAPAPADTARKTQEVIAQGNEQLNEIKEQLKRIIVE